MLKGYFLGGFRLCAGDVAIDGLTTRKSRSLVAYLMLNADRTFGREVLAETIWGEGRAGDTMKALRQELWLIRKAFRAAGVAPEDHFALEGEDLGARGTPWVDAAAFEAALETSTEISETGSEPVAAPDPNPTVDPAGAARLEAAVAHYAGDLLPGLYDDWCLLPRELLRDRYIIAVERLMHFHASHADWPTSILHAKRLLAADPLLEHIHRDLMRFHYARGDRPAALRQFARCKALLRKELMIEPMAETVGMYEAIRGEAPEAATRSGSADRTTGWTGLDLRSARSVTEISALGAVRRDLNEVSQRLEAIIHRASNV